MKTLQEKLLAHEKPVGTFVATGSAMVVDCLGCAGLDFVILDNEHSPIEAETTCQMIRAAEARGLSPLVRVREISRPAILKVLDIGAEGIIIPDVHSVEDVAQVVACAKYYPVGQRGFCPTRKDGWGRSEPGTVMETMERLNRRTLVIPQCETADALAQIRQIAAMEGVDGVFIGPFDLSISMGIPGQFEHPDFQAALREILAACHAAGKPCLMFAANGAAAQSRLAEGYDGIALGLDTTLLIDAVEAQLHQIEGRE